MGTSTLSFASRSSKKNSGARSERRKPDVLYLRPGTMFEGEKLLLDSGKPAQIFCYNGERAFLTRFHRAWDDIIFEVEFRGESPAEDRTLVAMSQDRFSMRHAKNSVARLFGAASNESTASGWRRPKAEIVASLRAAKRPSYAHRVVWSLSALLWRMAWLRDHSSNEDQVTVVELFLVRKIVPACLSPSISEQ